MKLVLAAIHIKPSPRAMPLGPAMLAAVLRRAFGEQIQTGLVDLSALDSWRTSPSIWKRRAVPVTLIKPMKTAFPLDSILEYLDPMMMSPEKPVQQGLGWFLREAWKKQPEKVEPFLLKWKEDAGRTIIQYATEKMSAAEKLSYRRTKK